MYGCSVVTILSYMHIYFQAQVNNIKKQAGEKISHSLRRHLCSGWTRQNGRACGGHGFVSRNVSATHTLETNKNKHTQTRTHTNVCSMMYGVVLKEVVSWHATRYNLSWWFITRHSEIHAGRPLCVTESNMLPRSIFHNCYT